MRNGDPRLLSAGITRNSTFEADSGALREFVEQLQSRVGELQERIVEVERKIGRNSNNSSLPPSRDDAAAREERVNRVIREPIWPRSLIPTMLFPKSRPIARSAAVPWPALPRPAPRFDPGC